MAPTLMCAQRMHNIYFEQIILMHIFTRTHEFKHGIYLFVQNICADLVFCFTYFIQTLNILSTFQIYTFSIEKTCNFNLCRFYVYVWGVNYMSTLGSAIYGGCLHLSIVGFVLFFSVHVACHTFFFSRGNFFVSWLKLAQPQNRNPCLQSVRQRRATTTCKGQKQATWLGAQIWKSQS